MAVLKAFLLLLLVAIGEWAGGETVPRSVQGCRREGNGACDAETDDISLLQSKADTVIHVLKTPISTESGTDAPLRKTGFEEAHMQRGQGQVKAQDKGNAMVPSAKAKVATLSTHNHSDWKAPFLMPATPICDSIWSSVMLLLAFVAISAMIYFYGASLIDNDCTKTISQESDKSQQASDLLMRAYGLSGQLPSFYTDPFCLKDFSRSALQHAMPRLLAAFSVWLMGVYFNNLNQAWLQAHMAGYYEAHWASKSAKPLILWDLGFGVLPVLRSPGFTEFFPKVLAAVVFIRFAVFPGPFSLRWTMLRRTLLISGVLWLLRGMTIICTVLPNPDYSCRPHSAIPSNMFLEAFAILWGDVTCQDVLFSGHATVITLVVLLVMYYSALAPLPSCAAEPGTLSWDFLLKTIVWIGMIAGYCAIIASKFHYTVDVLLAAVLTTLIFAVYHSTVHQVVSSQSLRFLPGCIVAFICWFEEGSVDVALLSTKQLHIAG